jgi:predicted HTH transcriptional regulator
VTRATMIGLLIEQGLVCKQREGLVPTLAGFLLFGRGVEGRFPQVAVEVTFGGKRRQLIKGNLITQFGDLTRLLQDKDVNGELRVKTEKGSQKRLAYHPRSITEMVVNLLVHRSYDVQEPSHIDIRDGWGICFSNPGGLVDSVATQFPPHPNGGFRPVRSVGAFLHGGRQFQVYCRAIASAAGRSLHLRNSAFFTALWHLHN